LWCGLFCLLVGFLLVYVYVVGVGLFVRVLLKSGVLELWVLAVMVLAVLVFDLFVFPRLLARVHG
jgi:hypothetical protein